MSWDMELHEEVESWFLDLCEQDPESADDLVERALDMLAERGPSLGRPLVDRIKRSRHNNLKELATRFDRLQRAETAVRIRPTQVRVRVGGRRQGRHLE